MSDQFNEEKLSSYDEGYEADYDVASGKTIADLKKSVYKLMDKGFETNGNLVIHPDGTFYQPMVLIEFEGEQEGNV